ncbi:cytochrome-b5 reductase [Malassezia brasiliensis]|uniref:Cytochrome-b5 reductase n=1 Tax=Malassezia brasiliensis TaxID=1821822 RepID=A0AAF0DV06_9BASI|nr:cytochrome-b5 reductase [Malassezia brasiliensis]
MVWTLGARALATQAAPRVQVPRTSRRFGAVVALTCAGAGVTYWLCRDDAPPLPQPTRYAELTVEKSVRLPRQATDAFDPHEAPVHRLLRVRARGHIGVADTGVDDDLVRRLAIYAYYIKEPSLQVERAYTPLEMLARTDPSTLSFLVKRYADGEMSRYLHRLRPSSPVSLRGPVPTWELGTGPVPEEIVLVRGPLTQLVAGTGVSTAVQLLSNAHAGDAPSVPRLTVLYAAQSLDTLEMVPELAALQRAHPNVRIGLWTERVAARHGTVAALDGPPVPAELRAERRAWWWPASPTHFQLHLGSGDVLPLTLGRINADDLRAWSAPAVDRLVLVCGPDGFVRAMAGDKGRDLV